MSMSHTPYLAPFTTGDAGARVKTCRHRAEELRAIADDVTDDDCRVTLLRLAQSYERLASDVEIAARSTERSLRLA